MLTQHAHRGWPLERRASREELEQDAAECVEIGAPVDRGIAQRLLRAHVRHGADGKARGCHRRGRGVQCDRASNAKVGNERATATAENILRLDVTMHDATRMRVCERFGHVTDQGNRVGERESLPSREQRAQGIALDAGHDVKEAVPVPATVKQRDDRGVHEARRQPDLLLETALLLLRGG